MPTDDILDDGTTEAAEKPVQAPSVTAADISTAVKDGLSGFAGDMKTLTTQLSQQVQQVVQQAQQASERGNANQAQSDLTQQLLTEPEKAISGIVNKIMTDTLGPYLATDVQDKYEGLVETQRTKIDREYGDGTFDELVLPNLEAIVEQTPNKASKASKRYISTVVEGILGNEKVRPKLMEKHSEKVAATKKAELEAPTGILDGGRRRSAKPQLSADDIAYLAHYEEETGKKVDRKLMEESISVRSRDGSWTVDNFPGLTKGA